jgi:hypothetical protein
VVGELLKFYVILANSSSDTIRVVDIYDRDMDMKFMRMEIVTPEGKTEYRKTRYAYIFSAVNPRSYRGEPVAPGDSVQVLLYPNWSYELLNQEGRPGQSRRTFPTGGAYTVRICYGVPANFARLWSGDLWSNAIELRFREPSAEEKEILGPLWTAGSYALCRGDNVLGPPYNEAGLELVIAQYDGHPLSKYAYFALAKSLVTLQRTPDPTRYERGVALFRTLMESYPDFRYEEVRNLLAFGLDRLGRRNEAVRLMNATLRDRPGLDDNLVFMSGKIFLETQSHEDMHNWIEEKDPVRSNNKNRSIEQERR